MNVSVEQVYVGVKKTPKTPNTRKGFKCFFVSIYIQMNANERETKKLYFCKKCDFTSRNKCDWTRHLSTTKHKKLIMLTKKLTKYSEIYTCETCSKEYKHRSSLCRHKKICKKRQHSVVEDNKGSQADPQAISVVALLQELIQVQKENQEKQKELISIQKTNKPITQNNNISINVFLNEHCKDAINLTDFVENIKLTCHDLLTTKEIGYAGGISTILIKNLHNLPVPRRPIHCADTKRLKFYIKDGDGWNHEKSGEKMEAAIDCVTRKQIQMLKEWQNDNPNYIHDSKLRNEWHEIVQSVMGGSNNKERERNTKNIKKAIGEETVLKEAIMEL